MEKGKHTSGDTSLDANLRATASLCHDELTHILREQAGTQIKTLAIAMMTDRGAIVLLHGCKCENCAMGIMAQLGRAFGGVVEIGETETPQARDASGQVH